jgi:hypothetical protein
MYGETHGELGYGPALRPARRSRLFQPEQIDLEGVLAGFT